MFGWLYRDNCGKFDKPPLVNVRDLIPDLRKVRKPGFDWNEDFGRIDSPYVNHYGVTGERLSSLRDLVLVDLGAGSQIGGYKLVVEAGASGYVGVERFNSDYLAIGLRRYIDETNSTVPAAVIHADMLDFLNALPDNSVSVLTSGIDKSILQNRKYADKVRLGIQRVVGEDNIHLTYCSPGLKDF